jgi:hypothetical protein
MLVMAIRAAAAHPAGHSVERCRERGGVIGSEVQRPAVATVAV